MVVKKKTLNNKSKLRSKNNNRTHKKKQLKKTKKQNRNKNANRHVNKHSRIHKRTRMQLGGGDDVEIYFKKPGLLTFGKINASTDKNTPVEKINSKQIYELPHIKFSSSGNYKFIFSIKDYDNPNISTSTSSRYPVHQASSPFDIYAAYTFKHNKILSDEKQAVKSIDPKVIDKYAKFKEISIYIKVYKIEKNLVEKHIKDYYFNLKTADK
jgi:hypothetical protein